MKPSKLSSTLFAVSISVLLACSVALVVYAGTAAKQVYESYLGLSDAEFGLTQLGLLVGLAVGFAILCYHTAIKKALVYWFVFTVSYFGAALIAAAYFELPLFPITVVATTALVCVITHLIKLWRIDSELTDRLVSLVDTGNALSDSAEMRVETSLKLLKSIFPVSEIIVFQLKAKGKLEPIGRAKKDQTNESGVKRNATWQDTVRQCENALTDRDTIERLDEYEENSASLAIPLDTGDEIVGVLFVDIRENYEQGDRMLLESFARQLARNFQRKLLNGKSLPHTTWWSSLSSQSSENRLLVTQLVEGILHEKSFGSQATSKLDQAHAVAYLDGTLAFLNPKMLERADLKESDKSSLSLFELLDKFKTPVFSAPELAVRRVLQTRTEYRCELNSDESDETLELKILPVSLGTDNETTAESNSETGETMPSCLLITVENIATELENKQLRSDLANLMSHELRTPITSINGFAEMLLNDGDISPDSREYLSIISSEAKRASALLSNFLSVANLEQGDKVEFTKTPVRVESVVNEVIEEFEPRAKQKRIRIVNKGSKELPQISADRGLISRAIAHLVDNAIRYSPERSSVMISTILETDFLRVDVEDRGYGIPKGEFEKIWQKFYRVSRDGQSKEEETTGLGLSLVKEIAEQHEGKVGVASAVGRGSRFSFRIPRL